jgi:hypothetical protein
MNLCLNLHHFVGLHGLGHCSRPLMGGACRRENVEGLLVVFFLTQILPIHKAELKQSIFYAQEAVMKKSW